MYIWQWWFVFNVGVLALAVGQFQFDLMNLLYGADSTYLSFLILAIAVGTSVALGVVRKTVRGSDNNMFWFLSDAVLSIGMVGTLFGFRY